MDEYVFAWLFVGIVVVLGIASLILMYKITGKTGRQ